MDEDDDKHKTTKARRKASEDNTQRARMTLLAEQATNAAHVDPSTRHRRIPLGVDVLDAGDATLKEDIIRIIIEYLRDENYTAAALTLQDEANVKLDELMKHRTQLRQMASATLSGDWAEAERLCTKNAFRNHKQFLYAIYRQQYLEHIDKQEFQKAFALLTKRLKPLEHLAEPSEFRDLCYILTCKSVQDGPSFRDWDGVSSRERLLEQFQSLLEFEIPDVSDHTPVPPNRLLTLLRQAVAYQIELSRYHPKVYPKIRTLLEDYRCFVLPNACKSTFRGHKQNVKCVTFIGEEGVLLASGSSDNTVKIWNTETGELVHSLEGHLSRVWNLTANAAGTLLASASADETVKLWDARGTERTPTVSTLKGHERDVYSVSFHPQGTHLVTGGYDKVIRLYDVRTGQLVKSFTGHDASISTVIFNPHGNLVVSGSKDCSIRFWDLVSGLCIKTYSSHLGEVTSVEVNSSGSQLLTSSKDNCNRLWDVRQGRPIQRFQGHQNTSKNFIRSGFGPGEALIVSGSEDGFVFLWDIATGHVLQRLGGHDGVVYDARWSLKQSLLASCSDDFTIKTWWYDQSLPVFRDEALS